MPVSKCSDCTNYVVTSDSDPGKGICVANAPSCIDCKDRDSKHQWPEVTGDNQNVCGQFKKRTP